MRTPILLLLLGLTACSSGNYVGLMTPQAGQPERCGKPVRSLLAVEGKHFTFAPDEGVLTFSGPVAADGTLHAIVPIHDAAGHMAPPMRFDGKINSGAAAHGITGTVARGGCLFDVELNAN